MKIGIITIQKSEVNFGACLQNFALWKYVSSLGHNCEVIDLLRPCHKAYRISSSFGEYKKPLRYRIKTLLYRLLLSTKEKECIYDSSKYYSSFNNKVKYSAQYKSVESLYKSHLDYDLLISGSDQIWNPKMPFLNAPYFLTFASDDVKKISYASSFGIDSIPTEVMDNYKKWLLAYSHLSTREASGAKIIKDITGKEAEVVLDPVFLLDKTLWQSEMKPYNGLQTQKYIFLYMLQYNEKVMEHALLVAKTKNLPLYFVLSEPRAVEIEGGIQIKDIGPAEWMWLIDNAETMVTTSFHGTAFCVIFNTPFLVFLRKNNPTNTRIEGILKSLDLQDHIYDQGGVFLGSDLNASLPNELESTVEVYRKKSIDYLNNAIGA